MIKGFRVAAVTFIAIAAYFLWSDNRDGMFVTAVLGAASYFISLRFQTKDRLKNRDLERPDEAESEILRK